MKAHRRLSSWLAVALLLCGGAAPASAALARSARPLRLPRAIARLLPLASPLSARPAAGAAVTAATLEAARPAERAEAARTLELPPSAVAAAAAPAPEPAALPEIERLNELGEVRVLFANAPGFGHQAATLSLVRRLRELGFRGKIDAVFEDDTRYFQSNEPLLRAKLAELLPGFDPLARGEQRIKTLGMAIRPMSRHVEATRARRTPLDLLLRRPGKARVAPVTLALSGGADKLSSKQVEELGAETFLRLGPMGWDQKHYEDQVWRRGEIEKVEGNWKRALIYEPAGLDAADDAYFKRLPLGAHERGRARALAALARKAREADVLPVYGLAFMDGQMLYRTALAVSEALEQRPELFRGKGVILPLLLDAPKVEDGFERLMRGAPARSEESIRGMAARLQRRLVYASVSDPDIEKTLARLDGDQILVLRVGPVPPTFFEWLFRVATLPPTLEGMNGRNLARLLGKPFIPVHQAATRYLQGHMQGGGAERLKRAIAAAQEGLWGQPGSWEPGVRALKDYLVEAMTPGSALNLQAQASRLRSDDREQDKLLAGLRAALGRD